MSNEELNNKKKQTVAKLLMKNIMPYALMTSYAITMIVLFYLDARKNTKEPTAYLVIAFIMVVTPIVISLITTTYESLHKNYMEWRTLAEKTIKKHRNEVYA